jgi:hypothetical protein
VRFRFFNVLATLIAVVAGLITLVGYFARTIGLLQDARLLLLSIVSLLAAWAVLAGALNLLLVHGKKFLNQAPGWFYSLFVILGFLAVVLVNLIAPFVGLGSGAASAANAWLLHYLIGTGGAAVAGMVAFFLVFAGYRLMRTRPAFTTLVFVLTAIAVLVVMAPWPTLLETAAGEGGGLARNVLRLLVLLPASAGARGLLLGVALGAIATGLRVLLALDRPYGG